MINPKMHKQGSPEWVLAKFLEAWKRRAWKKMVDYIRSSWLDTYTEPDKVLKLTFNPTLIDARLIQANARTPAVTEYLIEIEYMALRAIPKKNVTKIRLYSEMKPFQEMIWRVDPTTIVFKFELIQKAEPKPATDKAKVEEETASVESREDEPEEEQRKVEKKGKKVPKELEPEA